MPDSVFSVEHAEESLGLLLWQTTTLWQRKIKQALLPHGISHAQFVLLANLLWCEEVGELPIQAYLVQQSKLDKMTVSQGLKKLATMGLIERVEHQQDTRAKLVSLTDGGRGLARNLVPIVEAIDQAFFAKLPAEKQKTLRHILQMLVSRAE